MGLKKSAAILPGDLFNWMYEFYHTNLDKMSPSDIKFFKIFAKTLAYEFDEKASLFDVFVDKVDHTPSAFNLTEALANYKPNMDAQNDFKDIL